MIVDTSALIEIVRRLPEADRCLAALIASGDVSISTANLVEAYLVVDATGDPDEFAALEELIRMAGVRSIPVTESMVDLARDANSRFGRRHHPARLNFGDCFAYALANATGEPLLFVGNDFSQTDIIAA